MSPPSDSTSLHRWRFFRPGGLDQVRLETAEDLAQLEKLDQKLWVALACPVQGLELDERTLALIDTDQDGRVRANEVLDALRFCRSALKDLSTLLEGRDALPLSALDEATDEGRRALTSAREILRTLGKPDATEISLEDVSAPRRSSPAPGSTAMGSSLPRRSPIPR